MIDASFVKAIAEQAYLQGRKPTVLTLFDRPTVLVPQGDGDWIEHEIPRPLAMAEPLQLATLAGLVAYAVANRDSLDLDSMMAVIDGPGQVRLVGPPKRDDFMERPVFATANLAELVGNDGFPFGQYLDPELFIISLQSRFAPTPAVTALLKLVGSIKDESVRQLNDDGVTQTVTARAGAVLAKDVDVQPVVTLAPFRTFREVEQPESRFILRLRRGSEGQKPSIALFEADGQAWKLVAVERIAAYLRNRLEKSGVVVVA
jgi:hypothetical protein